MDEFQQQILDRIDSYGSLAIVAFAVLIVVGGVILVRSFRSE